MTGTVILQRSQAPHWLYFQQSLEIISTTDPAQVYPLLNQIEEKVNRDHLYAAGFIAYEAASAFDPAMQVHSSAPLPLLWFGLYHSPVERHAPPAAQNTHTISDWQPVTDKTHYRQAIEYIKTCIGRGETYQVNYTIRLRANFNGSPLNLFGTLIASQRSDYAAYIDTGSTVICSASPELFFQRDGTTLTSKPMKGTTTRGKTLAEDEQQHSWLYNSPKNRAENVMIVDMIRNDMGRIAQAGSIQVPQLFTVERYPTVLQMTSTVTAQTQATTTEIMAALFPCASITGAPKVRTMALINQLEPEPRGIYTGSIGYIAPNQQAQFNVAIRTVSIDKRSSLAEYGVGGGVVWDSISEQEYAECYLKARVLKEARPHFDLLETLLWTPDLGYFLCEEHLHRLRDSAHYFNIPFDYAQLLNRLETLAATFDQPHRVRLLIDPNGEITTQTVPFDPTLSQKPWRVTLASEPVDSNDRFLYHKTTHRQVYSDAKAARPGFDDVILWNEHGQITEATIANVVIQRDDKLLTPPLECGLLAGTFRAALLAQQKIHEQIITVDDLKRSDRLYLINSVRKWIEAVYVSEQ
ncbi:MAG: aminodeoxychorismate synthase component I [Anaerolineae bacterium]|nr:aminodeoxychorismate synthase component I [Anaerolineae bacterium]